MRAMYLNKAQGHFGTKLLATSFSMSLTMALQPVSKSTIKGTVFTFSLISVRIKPGCIVVTFMGVLSTSIRIPSLSDVHAALVAAYTVMALRAPRTALTEDIVTRWPAFWLRNISMAASH